MRPPLGRFIKRKALSLVSDFAASTAAGAKQHPFPETTLKEIRDFILPEHSQPAAGQPFFLDIQDVDSATRNPSRREFHWGWTLPPSSLLAFGH